jgi:muramoyltetrapeptide carboxypeptidase
VPGLVTFHGPTARATLPPFSERSLTAALRRAGDPCGAAPAARTLRPGLARGRLAGGNLALLAALAGTRWAPRFDGAIAVFEDVNEATYRVDRMLRQLLLAGCLDGCLRDRVRPLHAVPRGHEDDGTRTLAAGRARGRPTLSTSRPCSASRSATSTSSGRCRSARRRCWTRMSRA